MVRRDQRVALPATAVLDDEQRFLLALGVFSSTHSTMAVSGRSMYSPTMSRTLSTNIGLLESLKVSCR